MLRRSHTIRTALVHRLRLQGIIAALAITALGAASTAAAQPDDARQVAEVLALDAQRAGAFVAADVDFLDQITAANYTHVETSGLFRTKADLLAFLRAGEVRFLSFIIEMNEARIFNNVAVVTGTYNNQVATDAGPQPVKRARHQRVYVRGDGGWQIVAHQATEIATNNS